MNKRAAGRGPGRSSAGSTGASAGETNEPPIGPDGSPYTFEKAIERLEAIVDQLEQGELSLEDSIGRFEEGVKLTRFLETELARAQRRVEELAETAGGGLTTRPWSGERDLEAGAGEVEDEDDAGNPF